MCALSRANLTSSASFYAQRKVSATWMPARLLMIAARLKNVKMVECHF
jgi:hypothetical protein